MTEDFPIVRIRAAAPGERDAAWVSSPAATCFPSVEDLWFSSSAVYCDYDQSGRAEQAWAERLHDADEPMGSGAQ